MILRDEKHNHPLASAKKKKKKELRQTEMLVIVMSHKNSYSEIFCMT